MRKSKFFTFVFAMLPGAGQMYQGLMKRGVSIMIAFFSIIVIAIMLNLEELTIVLPVLWFYAFFDCMNKSSYTIDELSMVEDKMIFDSKLFNGEFVNKFISKKNTITGWVMILFGFLLLYNTILRAYLWKLERYLPGVTSAANKLPALILSIVIIILGIKLIKGPYKNNEREESYEE